MKVLYYSYFVGILIFFLIFLKILMSINIEKIFKKGKVREITFFHFLMSFVLSVITSFGLISFIYAILKVLNIF